MHSKSLANISQKEAFLYHLQTMDLEMLELIVDDSVDCFGVSKEVFLEKLSYIFTQFRLAGGKGFLKIKEHRKHHGIYYLYLEPFSYSIKFVIEEEQGKIISLHNPRSNASKEDIENLSSMEIFFGDDEKLDFKPSNEYIMNVYRCTCAYEEIITGNIQTLTSKDICSWVNRYALLYHEVKDEFLMYKYNKFRSLFTTLEYLSRELSNYEEAKLAIDSLTDESRAALKHWLEEFYDLAFCQVNCFGSNFTEMDMEGKVFRSNFNPNIYFKGDDFATIIKFDQLYLEQFDIYHNSN